LLKLIVARSSQGKKSQSVEESSSEASQNDGRLSEKKADPIRLAKSIFQAGGT